MMSNDLYLLALPVLGFGSVALGGWLVLRVLIRQSDERKAKRRQRKEARFTESSDVAATQNTRSIDEMMIVVGADGTAFAINDDGFEEEVGPDVVAAKRKAAGLHAADSLLAGYSPKDTVLVPLPRELAKELAEKLIQAGLRAARAPSRADAKS
jgi:hypothetical protein